MFAYAYVDDLLTVGVEEHLHKVMADTSRELLLKRTGPLHDTGDTVNMLGRTLQRNTNGILAYESPDYYTPIFEERGLQRANSVSAPSTSSLRADDSVELLSTK